VTSGVAGRAANRNTIQNPGCFSRSSAVRYASLRTGLQYPLNAANYSRRSSHDVLFLVGKSMMHATR
jgi:hypothetical protein